MRYFAYPAFAFLLATLAPMTIAAETSCKGDARREKPPIPNHPTHIRKVVWRNTRAMCLQELSRSSRNPAPVSQDEQKTPTLSTPPNGAGSVQSPEQSPSESVQ